MSSMSTDYDWEKEALAHLVGIRAQPDVINSGALDLLRRLDGLIRHSFMPISSTVLNGSKRMCTDACMRMQLEWRT